MSGAERAPAGELVGSRESVSRAQWAPWIGADPQKRSTRSPKRSAGPALQAGRWKAVSCSKARPALTLTFKAGTWSHRAQVVLWSSHRNGLAMGPRRNTNLVALSHANGGFGAPAQLELSCDVLPGSRPFGSRISTEAPAGTSVPGGPDVSVVSVRSTIGPSGG